MSRIFELRTYEAMPGRIEELHARFRDHTVGFFEKHGMDVVGFWETTDTESSPATLFYILAFPDQNSADEAWKAFYADDGWKKAKSDSEVNGPLVAKIESTFLAPTDYSPIV